jgi:diguanylate cyclase (GGDEF)-like protein
MDFRYDKKIVAIVFTIFGLTSFAIYSLFVQNGFAPETISIICFSIPSLIMCFMIAKYRGARFIFTFASIDLLAMTALILGRIIGGFFEYNQFVIFFSSFLLLIIYFVIAVLFRKSYLKILRTVKTGWVYMSIAVILMYIFTLMLIGYPTPLRERREYSPIIIVYILLVFAFFKVIYESANTNVKIYNERIEKDYLEAKLELSRMHYDMAYKDVLTGIKNRRAFEEYLEILEGEEKKLTCISMDINNLKKVNDEQGHHAGDELIKEFSSLLTDTFKNEEHIFRVGGDEFILIIENHNEEWIKDQLMKMDTNSKVIGKAIELPLEYARGECLGESKDIRDLLKKADSNMYKDKRMQKQEK